MCEDAVDALLDGFALGAQGADLLLQVTDGLALLAHLRFGGDRALFSFGAGDALALDEIDRAQQDVALDRLFMDPHRNSHNVLITPHLSQQSAARLRTLLARGGSVILVLIVSEETDPMTVHRAGGLRCNVVEVSPGAPLQAVFQHVMAAVRR